MKQTLLTAEFTYGRHQVILVRSASGIYAAPLYVAVRNGNRAVAHFPVWSIFIQETDSQMAGSRVFPYRTNAGLLELQDGLHGIANVIDTWSLFLDFRHITVHNPKTGHHIRYRTEINTRETPDSSGMRFPAEFVVFIPMQVIQPEDGLQHTIGFSLIPVGTEFPQQFLAAFGIPLHILQAAGKRRIFCVRAVASRVMPEIFPDLPAANACNELLAFTNTPWMVTVSPVIDGVVFKISFGISPYSIRALGFFLHLSLLLFFGISQSMALLSTLKSEYRNTPIVVLSACFSRDLCVSVVGSFGVTVPNTARSAIAGGRTMTTRR